MTVHEEEELYDLTRDEDDAVLQRGLKEAATISDEARDQGRKRKMSPEDAKMPNGQGTVKETVKDEVNFLDMKTEDEATIRWSLSRRRSEKKSPLNLHGSHSKEPYQDPDEDVSELPSSLCLSCIGSHRHGCSCDLHRSARAALPQTDHLEYPRKL